MSLKNFGLMSRDDKVKLNGLENYTLPAANSTTLGGVKVGSNIAVNNGTISVPAATSSVFGVVKVGDNINVNSGTISITKANVTNALGYTPPQSDTTYEVATASDTGLMSSSDKATLDYLYNNAVVSFQADSSNTSLMSAAGNVVAVIPVKMSGENVIRPIKSDPQLSLSSYSIGVGTNYHLDSSETVTVTKLSNGAISVEGESANSVIVTIDGKTITFSRNNDFTVGSYVFTVSVAETDDYQAASAEVVVAVGSLASVSDLPPPD